jgi:hypothetical protein
MVGMWLGRAVLIAVCVLPVAAGVALGQSVGVTAAVNQNAIGTPPSDKPRTMVLGEQVIHDEKIVTDGKGLLQILLADGTSFTVGPNSSMAIDSFVYDPNAGTAKVVATLGKGVFRFIGGRTSKTTDGAVLNTPVGTVGIRGGISDLDFSGHPGIPTHIDLLFGDGITLTDHGTVIGNVFNSGYSITIGPDHHVTIEKTPPGWTQAFQTYLASHGGQHGGSSGSAPTQVASLLKDTPPDTGNNPPAGTPGLGNPPPNDFTPPDLTSGNATWAEINASDLADSGARYSGSFDYTETFDGTNEGTGSFDLAYYFGADNGGGVFTAHSLPDGQGNSASLPVLPLSIDSQGEATFAGHVDQNQWAWGDINGVFTNTPAGVAHGVNGSADFFYQSPDDHVVGTFNGSLVGSAPLP